MDEENPLLGGSPSSKAKYTMFFPGGKENRARVQLCAKFSFLLVSFFSCVYYSGLYLVLEGTKYADLDALPSHLRVMLWGAPLCCAIGILRLMVAGDREPSTATTSAFTRCPNMGVNAWILNLSVVNLLVVFLFGYIATAVLLFYTGVFSSGHTCAVPDATPPVAALIAAASDAELSFFESATLTVTEICHQISVGLYIWSAGMIGLVINQFVSVFTPFCLLRLESSSEL